MRYSVETNLTPQDAIEEAIAYFGEEGLGLELVRQDPCCVYFEGGGGHVAVRADPDREDAMELETREWDYHVRQFMKEIG